MALIKENIDKLCSRILYESQKKGFWFIYLYIYQG